MLRDKFPILGEKVYNRQLVYLDNAATTQKPVQVLDAIGYAYTHFNANIHRGVHYLSRIATEEHEKSRLEVANFINAKSAKEIIFTKGTTDSINMLAFAFGEGYINEGDEIIVSQMEHHSNIVPWQMLCERKKAHLKVIPLTDDYTLDIKAFEQLITEKTKLVSVAHVGNVLGVENPVEQIITIAHRYEVPVLVDAAQSVARLKTDVQSLDCDFLAFSGHKVYGPTGIGVLYGKEKWLEALPPVEGGGEMIEHVSFDKTTFNTLPYKYEAGTPDFIGSFALAEALRFVRQTDIETISSHEQNLTRLMLEQLQDIKGVKVYASKATVPCGVVSFNVYSNGKLIHPFDVGVLLDHQGVAVRTGHHCAQPLMEVLCVPGTVRASVALYNDEEDIDIFVSALKKAVEMLV
ncbi:MAG: cysteine desulfurase [Paludibacteraceae bacterium]|nr:cysteine desulfurase [Paludibacteraceae bacterium]